MIAETILPLLGVMLCAIVVIQLGLWTANSFSQLVQGRKQYLLSQELLRKQIDAAVSDSQKTETPQDDGHWQGFRRFRVSKVIKETELCTSVYLQPTDKKPICDFKPGQHLTLKFSVPGQGKPVIRCYSLSQGPRPDEYRISVKVVAPPRDQPDAPPGLVSHFVNRQLIQGDLIDVKAPSGSFHLDTDSDAPVVMMAGGIGITPMMSMIEYVLANQPQRQVILFYGSRNGADHAFKSVLNQIQAQFKNIHVINVYSAPGPTDQQGVDFQVAGYVSNELIQQVLPGPSFQFYMCGPPPFMDSVFKGLVEWGVPESRIHFEAFGPASIGKKRNQKVGAVDQGARQAVSVPVTFSNSNVSVSWSEDIESILNLAEANGVSVESGCRAGSCGTCELAIKNGRVKYPEGHTPDCKPKHCLPCIAQPDGPLELDI